ncbi:DeoR faimly transcriptional regulator [Microbacterium mangrovi]|uniref:DeoR faimly transcriptional regulator n=1 Tax=Microbacterium mangrovi TaxID=1348253 RepID=A0A0B1ZWB5_9MICO|nr:DeoR/GlpR family DNA-binding transcription regulator [Microbacterium mangrovi]KHK95498.1 DeoR faimly transcriptional regulator [Microbacterium mangrovi]
MARGIDGRQQRIREQLQVSGEVEFSALAQEFGVSEMTIRRDIDVLEEQGVVRKVIGGAIALGKIAEPTFESRSHKDVVSKEHIAASAVEHLSAHETVILDSGSTALAVAQAIRGRGLGLTVVTPSILVAVELASEPDTTVLLTGGLVRSGELSLIGIEAVESLARYNCDTFVMGVAGVDEARGFTDYHRDESAVKRAAVEASDRLIVVADHSKIGQSYLSRIAPLAAAAVIVTDADPAEPALAAAERAGVVVQSVPTEEYEPAAGE